MTGSPKTTKATSQADWDAACEFHIGRILAQAEAGHCDAAGRHASALVHMAVTRRAMELMKILDLRSLWKAMDIAKRELFDVKIGVVEASPVGLDCAPGGLLARQTA